MYTLILLVSLTGSGSGVALTSQQTPGFATETECKIAGQKAESELGIIIKNDRYYTISTKSSCLKIK